MVLAGSVNAMLSSMVPVAVGDVIAGKYRIDRVLGAGGMGVVVAAEHLQLRQIVAIKFVLPDALGSSEALERFLREARAVVRLRSEHVARVIDVGTLANGSPFMIMEFLSGSTLGALLERESPLPVSDVVYYIIQACEALAEAHSLGIVHRDLKPENLFLTHSVSGAPLVKVLDFGVSKMDSMTGTRGLTRTAALMGSPLYMAPEQMRSARDATARSDIWALGVVLYHLLGHNLPFDAESMPELCLKVTLERPVPLRSRRADVPGALETVVMRCLEKDPARRYGNAAELASALEPFAPPEASAAVERARLIATGMHPVDVSGPLDAAAGSFGGRLSQRASTPRSTTQEVAKELHRVRKRRYAGIAVGAASVALVVGLAVPLVVVYLEPEEPRVTPGATTTLQSARVTSTVESEPRTLETAETTTGPLVPPSPFAPPPEPAEAASALPGGALTDAKRQAGARADAGGVLRRRLVMRTTWVKLAATGCMITGMAWTPIAHAQSSNKVSAEALFEDRATPSARWRPRSAPAISCRTRAARWVAVRTAPPSRT